MARYLDSGLLSRVGAVRPWFGWLWQALLEETGQESASKEHVRLQSRLESKLAAQLVGWFYTAASGRA